MLNNNKLIAFVAFLFFISSISGEEMKLEIELGGPNDACYKYTKDAEKILVITHARIILWSGNIETQVYKTHQNILCSVKSFEDFKYTFNCNGQKSTDPNIGYFVLISVTTTQQILSGPIDYRYNENVSKLKANGFLTPENQRNQKFEHDKHIHIKKMTMTGVVDRDRQLDMTDCHQMFPRRLIADHGIYIIGSKDTTSSTAFLQRMYYEPYLDNDYFSM